MKDLHVLLHAPYKTENTNDNRKSTFFWGGGDIFFKIKMLKLMKE